MSLGTEALTCWNLFLEGAEYLIEFSLMPAIDVEDFVFVSGFHCIDFVLTDIS